MAIRDKFGRANDQSVGHLTHAAREQPQRNAGYDCENNATVPEKQGSTAETTPPKKKHAQKLWGGHHCWLPPFGDCGSVVATVDRTKTGGRRPKNRPGDKGDDSDPRPASAWVAFLSSSLLRNNDNSGMWMEKPGFHFAPSFVAPAVEELATCAASHCCWSKVALGFDWAEQWNGPFESLPRSAPSVSCWTANESKQRKKAGSGGGAGRRLHKSVRAKRADGTTGVVQPKVHRRLQCQGISC